MLQIALRQTAEESKEIKPEAAKVLTENVYMDDICESVDTVEEEKELVDDIDIVLKNGGFQVKGWISNKELCKESKYEVGSDAIKMLHKEAHEKVLGIVWGRKSDTLSLKVKSELMKLIDEEEHFPEGVTLTKRKLLSEVAKMYDPVGFPAAFIVRAKIGMQDIWQTGVDWDTEIPTAVQGKWIKLFKEMKDFDNVSFKRALLTTDAAGKPSLCLFSDASQEAFGACAYLRQKIEDGRFDVTFIATKSRVAPLKQLTKPRLGFQAAVLASRLAKSIQEECRIEFKDVKFFTDSSMALAWIQSPSRNYKPCVSSRIGEIQSNSDPSQWRHIPSEDNVADDLSRGIHVQELNGRWMHGPDFLQLEEEFWPPKYGPPPAEEDNEYRHATKVHMVINARDENFIDYERFSSWTRLIRVTAWIKRLAENIRQQKCNQTRHNGPLTPEELQKAEMFLIKDAQSHLHDRLKRGEFKSLSPFTNDKGIIRVGGRVDKAIMSYETRHPAMLPNDHRISLLITRHMHHATWTYRSCDNNCQD